MSSRRALRNRLRRAQRGWPASYPLAQFPNAPLLVALGGWVVATLTRGPARSYARATHLAGLASWAWAELAEGVNPLRRLYGAGGLAYVVAKIGAATHGRRVSGRRDT